jgi:hypothetical protein
MDPPVMAGQLIRGYCSGGIYARLGDQVVLTSTGHCVKQGTVAYDQDDGSVIGVFGPAASAATCPYPDHVCAGSDLNYLVLQPDRIPWGHLNLIDMGSGGYRTVAPGTRPLACTDINVGDRAEIDGRGLYRSGEVAEKGDNLKLPSQDLFYFPCMVAATIRVDTGDSGGVVLVRGIPAGVTSRSFSGWLGFTPLAEGMAELGLQICDTPDCGLEPPARS